jgi:transglutaminase/protease-like cytokinesis protein 3
MEKARQIADLAEEKESDYEKIKLIHDEIIKGCDYDADADFAGTAYGSLCEGKGLCEGYSKAFTLLCDLIGIQSVPVTGTAVDEDGLVQSHIWNKVLCDGVWYNVDCTWDDPTGIDDSDYVRYDYFLVCDADMAQTHTEDTNEFMPATVAWDASGTYFVREGLTVDYYTDVYAVFTEEVRKCFDGENPDKIIRFRCCDEQVLQYVKNTLFSTDYSGEEKGIYQILTGFMDSGEQIKYLMSENDKLNIINIRLKTDY